MNTHTATVAVAHPVTHPVTHPDLSVPAGHAAQIVLGYKLRFASLFDPGRALAFPCDAAGIVVLDALSERGRRNYLYARALLGRDFAMPAVVPDSRAA